jgi:alpha-N-arabinofuranosidase
MAARRNAGKKPFGRAKGSAEHYPEMGWIKRWMSVNLRAEAVIHLDEVEGEIDPRLYGLSVPDLDPSSQEAALIRDLHPGLLRAELGGDPLAGAQKLASFLNFCEACGAEPYLVLDVQAMTPQIAADWVAYCQAPAGHPEPYSVGLWGLSVGSDFIDAEAYIHQVKPFIKAMRAVNPDSQLAVTGKLGLPGTLEAAGRWNRLVLEEFGDQVDVVAVEVVHPGVAEDGTPSDSKQLYHSLLSAPHDVEEAIQNLAGLIREVVPDREIGIALDGFGLQLPGAPSLRDGLYVAGMLNAFHRQAGHLKLAALAQPENALPLTIQPEGQIAFPTPLYFPYQLYSKMEPQVLASAHWSPVFQAEALGDAIRARNQVPYIDLTATRSADGRRVVLAVTNRNPQRKAQVMVTLKGEQKPKFQAVEAWLMSGPDPLAVNTANAPEKVGVKAVKPPKVRYSWLDLELPPASLILVVLEKSE